MGKYTVHILPEGVAKLNPDGHCFCLGPSSPSITLPIKINGTNPVNIQLTRIDTETALAEIINLSHKEIKKLSQKAPRDESPGLRYLPFVVKQPGLYRLTKVKDVSELDVRVHRSEALVVKCPKATIKPAPSAKQDMCKGDLSNLSIQLEGLAPLSVTYSREVRGKPITLNVGRIHPENYQSPLLSGFPNDGFLAEQGDQDLAWAKRETIPIPLNDTLGTPGSWIYEIDKVTDGCGNVVDYKAHQEETDSWLPRYSELDYKLMVHERPLARFHGCDTQNPMELPSGKAGALPISLSAPGATSPFHLQLAFTPYAKLGSGSQHAPDHLLKDYTLKSVSDLALVKEPGLYTMRSISSMYCSGDVLEPATCIVITPPEPSMTMEYDEILDKCTGSSIGLTIDLTLVGSPPFDVSYRLIKDKGEPEVKTLHIDRTRHQVRFTPESAGHYAYEFFNLDDKNYGKVKIDPSTYRVEQTVKPLAGATFISPELRKTACIDEPVEFDVKMQGTMPVILHYDLIHGGRRTRISNHNITSQIHTIRTPPLANGGEYSLALTSVEDQTGCKIYLESEARVNVRFERPKAQFSPVEEKMSLRALEGKTVNIPMRLTGEKPWRVVVRNIDKDESGKVVVLNDPNTSLKVKHTGTYVIESVHDDGCPGTVVEPRDRFTVTWIDRPKLRLPPSSSTTFRDDVFVRNEVCEGDEDSVEIAFTGQPPFIAEYERLYRPESGSKRQLEKIDNQLTAGLGSASVRLETSKPGLYVYTFTRVSDGLYDDPREAPTESPIILEQTVHPRPSSMFVNPSKVYKYCLDSAAGEDSIIPIQLQGVPPFSLSIKIKHYSSGQTEVVNIPHIDTNLYNFKLPSHVLTLGDHAVSVNQVRDSRGCERKPSKEAHVMVAVADMPTIAAADQRNDYCVGERIAFTLSGVPPFAIEYEWNGALVKATNQPSQFVRLAKRPGNFTITGLQDSASDCKVNMNVSKTIHDIPSVLISGGTAVVKGIPEGDQAEIVFQFHGTPPFTFTYTRSEIAKKGHKPRILEMHSQRADTYTYSMFASQEGTYEVISIEDQFCSYSTSTSGRKA